MKEATGELNMTVVTIVAIAAIGALLWLLWPSISKTIQNAWGSGTQNCGTGQYWDPASQSCVSSTTPKN